MMKKVTSVDHALEVLNQKIDFDLLKNGMLSAGIPVEDIEPNIADLKIKKIIQANNKLNKFKVDWNNPNQNKYSIWKWIKRDKTKPSGSGFSFTFSLFWHSSTDVGSRLLVGSHEEAMYIGNDFEELFEIAWFIIEREEK